MHCTNSFCRQLSGKGWMKLGVCWLLLVWMVWVSRVIGMAEWLRNAPAASPCDGDIERRCAPRGGGSVALPCVDRRWWRSGSIGAFDYFLSLSIYCFFPFSQQAEDAKWTTRAAQRSLLKWITNWATRGNLRVLFAAPSWGVILRLWRQGRICSRQIRWCRGRWNWLANRGDDSASSRVEA